MSEVRYNNEHTHKSKLKHMRNQMAPKRVIQLLHQTGSGQSAVMDDDDHDSDPDWAAVAGAGPCPSCSSPCAVVTWRGSVKRKLDGEKRGREEGDGAGASGG